MLKSSVTYEVVSKLSASIVSMFIETFCTCKRHAKQLRGEGDHYGIVC